MTDASWGTSYRRLGEAMAPVHERVVALLAPEPGVEWLDVACGAGGVALLAARIGATVTGLDLSLALLAEARAAAAGLDTEFVEGDAAAMPFDVGSFDVVTSTFGVVFVPDAGAAARELARVARPGARLALTSWTEGDPTEAAWVSVGADPPRAGHAAWSTPDRVRNLLVDAYDLEFTEGTCTIEADSGEAFWDFLLASAPPVAAAANALSPARRAKARRAFADIVEETRDGDVVRPWRPYLLALGTRRADAVH